MSSLLHYAGHEISDDSIQHYSFLQIGKKFIHFYRNVGKCLCIVCQNHRKRMKNERNKNKQNKRPNQNNFFHLSMWKLSARKPQESKQISIFTYASNNYYVSIIFVFSYVLDWVWNAVVKYNIKINVSKRSYIYICAYLYIHKTRIESFLSSGTTDTYILKDNVSKRVFTSMFGTRKNSVFIVTVLNNTQRQENV